MPTKKYKDMEQAWQALTDSEIVDDSREIPCAVIPVRGIPSVKITMVSEYDYWYILEPLRIAFINYYATRFMQTEDQTNKKKIVERLNILINEISKTAKAHDIDKTSHTLSRLFDDMKIRKQFFTAIKKMGCISWRVSWRRWQKKARPHHLMTAFVYLWKFNVDGVKKKALDLLSTMGSRNVIGQNTSQQSLSVLSPFFDMDTYKKRVAEASTRVTEKIGSYPKSNGSKKSGLTSKSNGKKN